MEYFSEQDFRDNTRWLPATEQRKIEYYDSHVSSSTSFDVFLSYNIADLAVVRGIYHALSKEGLKVYLDVVVDPQLNRYSTDKNTAEIIRGRLEHSKSIIYAESPNANKSNWMPWEVGVVDGKKGKCMVMLLKNSLGVVPNKREYLSLYPTIHPSGYGNGLVVFSGGSYYRIPSFIR